MSKSQKRRSGPKKTARKLSAAHKKIAVANLKPWKKGQSGNPNGRPKSIPKLDKLLREILGGTDEEGQDSVMAEMIKALVEKGKDKKNKQSVRAIEVLLERAYGRVPLKDSVEESEGSKKPKVITGFKIVRSK